MSEGRFSVYTEDKKVREIFSRLSGEPVVEIQQLCERYGSAEDDVRRYDVYTAELSEGSRVLKKTNRRELSNYQRYLGKTRLNVPRYFGSFEDGGDVWILLENITGKDLRDMTVELAISAADSLAEIQNTFMGCSDTERFEVYRERIEKRQRYIDSDPLIGKAYDLFVERQNSCPRTLSNGDFLQFNAIEAGGRVYVIDWGFGGIMPYSLDIARFIAHGTENRATFPFYMTVEQKKIFLRRVYEKLTRKPEYGQFIYDIKLAVLNEYVEFIEAEEDEDKWYYEHAVTLAGEILKGR